MSTASKMAPKRKPFLDQQASTNGTAQFLCFVHTHSDYQSGWGVHGSRGKDQLISPFRDVRTAQEYS